MVVKHENVCIVDLLGRYKNHNAMGLIPKGAMRKIGGSDLKLVCASQCMTLVPSKKETLKYKNTRNLIWTLVFLPEKYTYLC